MTTASAGDPPNTVTHAQSAALTRMQAAVTAHAAAKRAHDPAQIAYTTTELQVAVTAVNALGISWQVIGDALGMRRGAAYQRFRRRST